VHSRRAFLRALLLRLVFKGCVVKEQKVKLKIPKEIKTPKISTEKISSRKSRVKKATKEPKLKLFKTKLKAKSKMRKI